MGLLGLISSQAWGESVLTTIPSNHETSTNALLFPSLSAAPLFPTSSALARRSVPGAFPSTNPSISFSPKGVQAPSGVPFLRRSSASLSLPALTTSSQRSTYTESIFPFDAETDVSFDAPSSSPFMDHDLLAEESRRFDESPYWVLTDPQSVVHFDGSQTWGIHVDVLEDRGAYFAANFERLEWSVPETVEPSSLIHWKTTGVSEETDPWDPTSNEYRDGGVIRVEKFDVPEHRLYWSVEGNPMDDISDAATVMDVNDLKPFGVVQVKPNAVLSVNTPKSDAELAVHLAANAGIFWCQSNVIQEDRVLTPPCLVSHWSVHGLCGGANGSG